MCNITNKDVKRTKDVTSSKHHQCVRHSLFPKRADTRSAEARESNRGVGMLLKPMDGILINTFTKSPVLYSRKQSKRHKRPVCLESLSALVLVHGACVWRGCMLPGAPDEISCLLQHLHSILGCREVCLDQVNRCKSSASRSLSHTPNRLISLWPPGVRPKGMCQQE